MLRTGHVAAKCAAPAPAKGQGERRRKGREKQEVRAPATKGNAKESGVDSAPTAGRRDTDLAIAGASTRTSRTTGGLTSGRSRQREEVHFKTKEGLDSSIRSKMKKPLAAVSMTRAMDQVKVYRSRHVAMELKHQYVSAMRDELLATVPPHEGIRLLLSFVASRQGRKLPRKLMFIDISTANLHAGVFERINICRTCAEGRLLRALKERTKTLKGEGFQRRSCNPCVYYHPCRDVSVLDFTVASSESELKYEAQIFQNE